jgi:hypothetical protein
MIWPENWYEIDPVTAAAFEEELSRELSRGHPLHGLPLRAVGQGGNGDDILFEITDGSGRVAVAHLTWARREEPPPWPGSMIYESREAWALNEETEFPSES